MKLKFFHLAEKLSHHSNHPHHRHGAVITYKNRVVGVGFNQAKTHARSNHSHNHIHAEFAAILNSRKKDFKDHDIYIIRRTKDGQLAMSKPCSCCSKLLKTLQFYKIHYSTKEGYKSE